MSGIVVYRVDILKRVAIASVIGAIVITGFTISRHYIYLDYNFNGRVDSIRYGDKGTSIIIIKGNEFDLNDDWSKREWCPNKQRGFNDKIERFYLGKAN